MRPALVALAGLAAALVLGGARTIPAQDQAETRFPVNPPPGGEAPGGAAQPQGGPVLDLSLREGSEGRNIPWDSFDRQSYLRVRDVVADAFAAREVRDITFRSRPEVFDFLLDHPDFASEVGLALRRGKYRVWRVGDAYESDDGAGARGRMWQVLREGGRRVFYIEGRYEGVMLPTFTGRMVVMLDTDYIEGPDGLTYCEARFASFVKFDTFMTGFLVRAAQGLSQVRVERQVRNFFKHVAAVNRRAYDDPEGLADELEGRPGVSPALMTRFREVLTAHLPPRWARPELFELGTVPSGLGPLDIGAESPAPGNVEPLEPAAAEPPPTLPYPVTP